MESGRIVTELFEPFGRAVSAFVPAATIDAVVYVADAQHVVPWAADLIGTPLAGTLVVGPHRADDEDERLQEYSPGFAPERFEAHERFVIDDVQAWIGERFAIDHPTDRTAIFGASAGGELALALGVRHPDVFGAVLCTSPGAGFRPPEPVPATMPRTYLVAGDREPFFAENAARWATALEAAGIEHVTRTRPGDHGDPFWRAEFALMVNWAFAR